MVQTTIISYLVYCNGLLSVSTLISQQPILHTAWRNCSLKCKSYQVILQPKLPSVLPLYVEKIQTLKHTLSGFIKGGPSLPLLATSPTTSSLLTMLGHTGLLAVLHTGPAYNWLRAPALLPPLPEWIARPSVHFSSLVLPQFKWHLLREYVLTISMPFII